MHKSIDPAAYRPQYPFRSRYLNRKGFKLHFIDEGEGDPVVFLHGNPTWSFFFRKIVKALSPSFRTIAPDHLGCGLSDKPDESAYDFCLQSRVQDFSALMDHLRLERVTLVLHDWGGMIGLAWAIAHPGRAARLVVTNTAGFLPPGNKKIPLRLRIIRDVAAFARPAVLYGNLFALGAACTASHKPLSTAAKKGLLAPYNCPRHRLATLRFVQDIPLLPADPGFSIVDQVDRKLSCLSSLPVLILWGQHDFVFDLDYYDEWRRRFPAAEAHLFADAGHYLFEDVPDRISERISAFLTQNPIH